MAEAVRWSPEAARDLQEIHDFIASDSPAYAANLCKKIYDAIGRLAVFPRSAPEAPELPGRRQLVVDSYLVIYRVDPGAIAILAIVHGARSLPDTLENR